MKKRETKTHRQTDGHHVADTIYRVSVSGVCGTKITRWKEMCNVDQMVVMKTCRIINVE